jgi:hypothetical protein
LEAKAIGREPRGVVSCRSESAAGDRRDDADLVAVGHGRVHLVEVADVLIIDVDVHEPPNFPAVEDAVLQVGEVGRQGVQDLADRGAGGFEAVLAPGEGAEGVGIRTTGIGGVPDVEGGSGLDSKDTAAGDQAPMRTPDSTPTRASKSSRDGLMTTGWATLPAGPPGSSGRCP